MRVVVSAGEASGRVMLDLFRQEMARIEPGCEVVSLAETAELGPVFGFAEGLRFGTRMRTVIVRAEESVVRLKPDVVVLVSFSGLHLPLGRRLRRRGLPVLYLGPPQVWAWGGWRKRRLRQAADKVVCLFRFEEELLRRAGVDAAYLGYPLLDSVKSRLSREQVLESLGLGLGQRYVVFLPGSRPAETTYHRPLFEETYERLVKLVPGIRAVMVTMDQDAIQGAECRMQDAEAGRVERDASQKAKGKRQNAQAGGQEAECAGRLAEQDASQKSKGKSQKAKRGGQEAEGGERLAVGMLAVNQDRYEVMRHAVCACAVSGTVTAELALLRVPMVVCYHLPALSRALARLLVRTPYFALPNILAGQGVVPEELEPGPEKLAALLASLVRDSEERRGRLAALGKVAAELGPPGAMARICATAREMTTAKPAKGPGAKD